MKWNVCSRLQLCPLQTLPSGHFLPAPSALSWFAVFFSSSPPPIFSAQSLFFPQSQGLGRSRPINGFLRVWWRKEPSEGGGSLWIRMQLSNSSLFTCSLNKTGSAEHTGSAHWATYFLLWLKNLCRGRGACASEEASLQVLCKGIRSGSYNSVLHANYKSKIHLPCCACVCGSNLVPESIQRWHQAGICLIPVGQCVAAFCTGYSLHTTCCHYLNVICPAKNMTTHSTSWIH